MNEPILYSFRRCPYCMRAHMGLKYSLLIIKLREVSLKEMPDELLKVSPHETVPVLILSADNVMDESWDILKWALLKNDPDNWLGEDNKYLLDAEMLVETNDFSFKENLDHYKYADRHPEHSKEHYRNEGEEFIEELEDMLSDNAYLLADTVTIADIAIFPFVRQFSLVDKTWFDESRYTRVQHWLESLINSKLFQDVFQKHDFWKSGDNEIYL